MRRFALCSCLGGLSLLLASLAWGTPDYAPKTDNRVICLDLRTGKLLWECDTKEFRNAHFELYENGLAVYPNLFPDDKKNRIFMDPKTGKLVKGKESELGKLRAKSPSSYPVVPLILSNGWELTDFKQGYSKSLTFTDPKTKKTTWIVETDIYPHVLAAWEDCVYYSKSYLSDEGLIHAFKAGEKKEAWSVDLNKIVKDSKRPLRTISFAVLDDVMYAQCEGHLFALNPKDGKLLWHRDVAADLKLSYQPDLEHGGNWWCRFIKSEDILVVTFAIRILAYDLKNKKYLWHLDHDSFPQSQNPVVYDGRLFLISGKDRKLTVVSDPPKDEKK
jgi:outer membrane protein assembly factor BamB